MKIKTRGLTVAEAEAQLAQAEAALRMAEAEADKAVGRGESLGQSRLLWARQALAARAAAAAAVEDARKALAAAREGDQ